VGENSVRFEAIAVRLIILDTNEWEHVADGLSLRESSGGALRKLAATSLR
jgi:hypothetical protein